MDLNHRIALIDSLIDECTGGYSILSLQYSTNSTLCGVPRLQGDSTQFGLNSIGRIGFCN
jgi:hypothetical protein